MRALRGGIWFVLVAVGTLVAPATASAALTFVQSAPTEARSGDTIQLTMTVGNTGPGAEQFEVGTLEVRSTGDKAVQNPVQSVTTDDSNGTCSKDPVNPPFNYHGVTCQLNLAPGESAQIVEMVTLNESMTNLAAVLDSNGAFSSPGDSATVWAIYPPRFLESSNKIKVKGLPDGCVGDRDPTVTVTAKGAKKITASLAGPYDEWHGRLFGSGFSGKIGSEKGKKLKLEVPLARERAGFYDLKLAAKYDNKPKQKTEISIQRCGIPDG
jgi:hypothetical protein